MPSRCRATLAVILALLCCALPALVLAATPPRPKDGSFRGRTSEGRTVRLSVVGKGRRVTFSIPWARIRGRQCRPRTAYVNANRVFDRRGAVLRQRTRTFGERIRSTQRVGRRLLLRFDIHVTGRFVRRGRRVTGAATIGARFARRGSARTLASCSRRLTYAVNRA